MTISTSTIPARRHRKAALAAALVATVALLPACGGDDDEPASGSGAASSPSAGAPASAGGSAAAADPATTKKDESGVRATYVAFEKASQGQDAAAVSGMVSSSTLDYFGHIRDLALDADQATLTKEPVVDQITALGMRAKMDPELLREGSPQDLVKASATAGAGAAAATPQATGLAEKAKITITGDKATAADPAQPATKLDFAYEGGSWKVDVTGIFTALNDQVKTMAQGDTTAFVEQAMASQVGGPEKAKALWKPLGR